MFVWPSDDALNVLRRLPAWEHGVEAWMLKQRAKQDLDYNIVKPMFRQWKSVTRESSLLRGGGMGRLTCVVFFVAILDIVVALSHLLYPLILVYVCVGDFSFASAPSNQTEI